MKRNEGTPAALLKEYEEIEREAVVLHVKKKPKPGGHLNDVKLEKFTKATVDYIKYECSRISISTDEDKGIAVGILTTTKNSIKQIEALRKVAVNPLIAAKADADAYFKVFINSLEKSKNILTSKMLEYERKLEAIERKAFLEAEKAKRELEKLLAEKAEKEIPAEKILKLEEKVQKKEDDLELASVAPTQHYTGGKATIVKTWTYEVVDVDKIPKKYMMPNNSAISNAVRSGIRNIPGVKIFKKSSVRS